MDLNKDLRIGEALKAEREKRDISLEAISDKTNISVNALVALENENIERIPGPFYLKNYIRTYLDTIGANADDFLKIHEEKIDSIFRKNGETASQPYNIRLRYSRFRNRKNIYVSLFLTTLIFIVVFYLIYTKKDDIFGGWDSKTGGISIPEVGLDFTAINSQKDRSRDYSPLNISIEFLDQCWIQISRGKEKLVGQVFKKGDKLAAEGYELTVYMANPAALRLTLNGKEVSYLQKLSAPKKLVLKPATIKEIFEK
jgi:cytoskeletal protein RodZ